MRTLRLAVLAAAVGALTCVAFAGTAGAGAPMPEGPDAPLTITKVVSGPVPAGTTFTVTVTCNGNIDGPDENVATVTFNAAGTPTSNNVIGFNHEGTCSVTETAAGGAATTTYACTGVIPSDEQLEVPTDDAVVAPVDPCGPITATGVSVLIHSQWQSATVTVTNTFVAATVQPASEVLARPAFTG